MLFNSGGNPVITTCSQLRERFLDVFLWLYILWGVIPNLEVGLVQNSASGRDDSSESLNYLMPLTTGVPASPVRLLHLRLLPRPTLHRQGLSCWWFSITLDLSVTSSPSLETPPAAGFLLTLTSSALIASLSSAAHNRSLTFSLYGLRFADCLSQ